MGYRTLSIIAIFRTGKRGHFAIPPACYRSLSGPSGPKCPRSVPETGCRTRGPSGPGWGVSEGVSDGVSPGPKGPRTLSDTPHFRDTLGDTPGTLRARETPVAGRRDRKGHYERGLFTGGISRISKFSKFSRISGKWSDSPFFSTVWGFSKICRISQFFSTIYRKWTLLKRPLFPKTPLSEPEILEGILRTARIARDSGA